MKNRTGSTPGLKDVAHRAGVSHQTVSRVINNHPNVSASTRSKVGAAIVELGYRRNTAARSLVTRRSRTIGILGTELAQYGSATTMLGVERAAREAGYFISIAAVRGTGHQAVLDAAAPFLDQSVDGIVAIAPNPETMAALDDVARRIPVVVAGAPRNEPLGGATMDQFHGAELAITHLLAQGHRRIGHVAGPQDWTDAAVRTEGWKTTLQSAGILQHLLIEGDWSAGSGYEIGKQLSADRSTTALFVANDQMALGLLRAFNEAHVRVPEDISVVGFDDQPESANFTPPLTTVRQDFEELGRRCMNVMLTAIQERKAPGSAVVTPVLVIRNSTAPPSHP